MTTARVKSRKLASMVMPAEEAAALIPAGANVGMSGFTGAGYPKAVPAALAGRMAEARAGGHPFTVSVWTGASTAPELDGALAAAQGIELRLPYQSDPVTREKINSGQMDYLDVHLSHVAQMVWEGFLGPLDVALVEIAGITEDGEPFAHSTVPPTSLGECVRRSTDVRSTTSSMVCGRIPGNAVAAPTVVTGSVVPNSDTVVGEGVAVKATNN